jgi:hypothetical protein
MTQRELDELISTQEFPPLPAGRLKHIENAVIADLRPVRPLASTGVYVAAFAGIFITVCVVGWRYIVGQHGWDALSNVQKFLVFVPLIAIAALLIFSTVRQMTPAAKYTRTAAILAAGLFVMMLAAMTVIFHPEHESAFVRNGLVCFQTGMLFAIPTAVLFTLLLKRGAALSPALTGLTAGGLAGLGGLTILEVHCPILDVYHIVVWHVSVTLVCAIAGSVLSSVTFRR